MKLPEVESGYFLSEGVLREMRRDGYECCVVSNEQKSGYNCAKLLDDYFNKACEDRIIDLLFQLYFRKR